MEFPWGRQFPQCGEDVTHLLERAEALGLLLPGDPGEEGRALGLGVCR